MGYNNSWTSFGLATQKKLKHKFEFVHRFCKKKADRFFEKHDGDIKMMISYGVSHQIEVETLVGLDQVVSINCICIVLIDSRIVV